jgi:hypothetical protein
MPFVMGGVGSLRARRRPVRRATTLYRAAKVACGSNAPCTPANPFAWLSSTMQDTPHSTPVREPRDATFTLRLPRTLIDELHTAARANERSTAGEVRLILAEHIARNREPVTT